MSWRRAAAALALGAALAGCGYSPMLADRAGIQVSDQLRGVHVETIEDRPGQILRTRLQRLMSPRGRAAEMPYLLSVTLSESVATFARRQDETSTRANLRLSGQFTLRDRRSGESLMSGTSLAVSSYDIVDSEFATTWSERSARDLALRQLAQDIVVRLSVYFDRSNAGYRQAGR